MHGTDRCAAHLGKVGRKTHLDPDVTGKLVAILRAGNYIGVACRAVNVPERTYRDWMTRGRRRAPGDEAYAAFVEDIDRARATGEVANVAAIANAARESWQAAAWLLERQYPERWGRVSVRVRDDVPAPEPIPEPAADPFAEVDELAQRRRGA
jgi:hypothetical protein